VDPVVENMHILSTSGDEDVQIPSARCTISLEHSVTNTDFVKVFPNPSVGPINFQSSEVMWIEIFNTMGQRVYENRFTKDDKVHLNSGTYIYRVTSGSLVNSGMIRVE
jgi:hypothetical protein